MGFWQTAQLCRCFQHCRGAGDIFDGFFSEFCPDLPADRRVHYDRIRLGPDPQTRPKRCGSPAQKNGVSQKIRPVLFSDLHGRRAPPDLYCFFSSVDGPKISVFGSGSDPPVCDQQHDQLLSEPPDRKKHHSFWRTQGVVPGIRQSGDHIPGLRLDRF